MLTENRCSSRVNSVHTKCQPELIILTVQPGRGNGTYMIPVLFQGSDSGSDQAVNLELERRLRENALRSMMQAKAIHDASREPAMDSD